MVLGGAAAIATGRPDLGQAITLGGQQVGTRSFLQYSRTQESAADQAGLTFLEATGQSARGLMEFMDILGDQELLSVKRQDPYVRTHPMTRERIDAIRAHVQRSPYSDRPWSPRLHETHARMRAKLRAFLEPFGHTMRHYPSKDQSLAARYARAIAYYRKPDLEKALASIDELIGELPRDPYFQEVKGQFLFENGRAAAALPFYQAAVDLAPHDALIRRSLAQVQLELDDPTLLEPAAKNLRVALRDEAGSPFTWRLLAIAYGRNGQIGESSLALAEEALLKGEKPAAAHHAGRAAKLLPRGSPGWLKAQDILQATKTKE
jgi:predicted Zn-dependent protease